MEPKTNLFEYQTGLDRKDLSPDLLSRSPLARQLALALQHQNRNTSTVTGLSGEWGSGKSWVIAKACQQLEADYRNSLKVPELVLENNPPSTPYSFEFEVWQWSGTDGLVSQFFDQLAEAIRQVEDDEAERKRSLSKKWWHRFIPLIRSIRRKCAFASTSKNLEAYSARLAVHSTFLSGYQKIATGFVALFTLFNLAIGDSFSVLIKAIAAAFIIVSSGLIFLADVFAKQADAKKKWIEANQKTPRQLKEDIKSQLRELPRPIVIVLDDLDRLTASEIAQVFQLVKTQADFPNIHYLLGFDRRLIAAALEKDAPNLPINGLPRDSGHHFLEKIVPVIFNLTSINDEDLSEILRENLSKNTELPIGQNSRWDYMWTNILKFYFTNLRDLERFENSLVFNRYLISGIGESMDVDVFDFIGIETLRLFEPEVYTRLVRSRELLTKDRALERQLQQTNSSSSESEVINEMRQKLTKDEITVTEICNLAIKKENQEAVRRLICHLFPEIGRMGKPNDFQRIYSDTACPVYAARVSNPESFRRFFRYSLAPNEWSAQEVSEVMKKISDPALFSQIFQDVANGKEYPKQRPESEVADEKFFWPDTLSLCSLVGSRVSNSPFAVNASQINKQEKAAHSLLHAGMIIPANPHSLIKQDLERNFGRYAHRALLSIEDSAAREESTLIVINSSKETFASNIELVQHEIGWHNQSRVERDRSLLLSPESLKQAKILVAGQTQLALENSADVWQRPQARIYLEMIEIWEDKTIKDRNNRMLDAMLYDDEKCFWLLEAFLLDVKGANQNATKVLMIDYSSVNFDGGNGISYFIPLWVLQDRIPQLEAYIISNIRDSLGQISLSDQISSPQFERRMGCLIDLKNYFGNKQQPQIKTSFQEELTKMLTHLAPQS